MRKKYDPPTASISSQALNDRVKEFMAYWDKFFVYTQNFLDGLFVDREPFTSVVAAATIRPSRQIQAISGGTTVVTIEAVGQDMTPITLLAIDGFSTSTAGNISAVVTLAAGTGRTFHFNPVTSKWMPS